MEQLFLEELRNPLLEELGDAAVAGAASPSRPTRYVVKPLFFPGGDIGELAVNGTVNDLAVAGAEPLWLSAAFVIEEGFPLADLRRIARSMARAAERPASPVVAGDTKVVERGSADGLFITTAGVGRVRTSTFGRRVSRATACSSRAPSATTASRSSSRAATSTRDRPRERHAPAHELTARSRDSAPRCAACATPPAAASRRR